MNSAGEHDGIFADFGARAVGAAAANSDIDGVELASA